MAPSYESSVHSYGRSNRCRLNIEEKITLLETLRNNYFKRKKEEEERKRQHVAEEHVIDVDHIETYPTSNASQHNTIWFELVKTSYPSVILRRGQPFTLCIHFKQQYDLKNDFIALQFILGPHPAINKDTLIWLPINDNKWFTKSIKEWDVRVDHEEPCALCLEVQISCKAPVGAWHLNVMTSCPSAPVEYIIGNPSPIYILFNPWCAEDAVYMESERNRMEYVINDIGKLFVGNATNPVSRKWVYGQYSTAVLPAIMAILDKSKLDDVGRRSPVKVVRAISAILNAQDDNGVLAGKWQEPYNDGIAPWKWTGSVDILDRYLTNGYQPVKYGQCWVFAGVFTTVCRALGIPCRPVTNYRSAHDTDDTLTIDRFFTSDGKELLIGRDSIWNFHVWNDCWMTRPDLPHGYGGWQAVDSTPQETSDGIYQAGPASLQAVRRGEVAYMYDTPFVFSEVNADVVSWKKDVNARLGWKRFDVVEDLVGHMVVTKAVGYMDYYGDRDMEHITSQYKNIEGTPEERMAVLNAASYGNHAVFDMVEEGDVTFDMKEIDAVMIGQSFNIAVQVENKSDENRIVTLAFNIDSVFYTGITAHTIIQELHESLLMPKQKHQFAIKIDTEDYYEKLVDYSMMKVYAVGTVSQTNQSWAKEDDFMAQKPHLKLEVSQPIEVGKPFELSITLENPLRRTLQNCTFTIESPGLIEPQYKDFKDIPSQETIEYKLSFVPKQRGNRNILVIFNSIELIDVQGLVELEVL